MIVEGHMQYVWDETGRRYLDAFAGIVTISVGHCHPKIVEQGPRADRQLQHTTTIYLHPTIVQFAEKLAEKMPPADSRVVLHQQRQRSERGRDPLGPRVHGQPGRDRLRNGYHGGTSVPMSLTAHGTWKFKSNQRHEHASHAAPATATAARSGWSIRAAA